MDTDAEPDETLLRSNVLLLKFAVSTAHRASHGIAKIARERQKGDGAVWRSIVHTSRIKPKQAHKIYFHFERDC